MDKLLELFERFVVAVERIADALAGVKDQPPDTEAGEPPKQENLYVRAKGKINTRYIDGYWVGMPVMKMEKNPNDRIQFFDGEGFWVKPQKIIASNGVEYYWVVRSEIRPKAVDRFVRVKDVDVIRS
jgi:hypothetical protein